MRNKPLSYSVDIKLNATQQTLNFDWIILLCVLALGTFGLLMIYSASGSYDLVIRQVIYFLIGILMMSLAAVSNFRKMEPIYLNGFWFGLILLIFVLLLPSDQNTNRWIDLGIISFQPSEVMRFLLPISAAAYLTRNPKIKNSDWLIVLIASLVACSLVFFQPDFGTAFIVLLSGLIPIILSGVPLKFIFGGLFFAILSLPILWVNLYDYQKERIFTFFSPNQDILDSGWNISQSKIAIGSGQLTGKGYINGSQSQLDFIPESHTDFIFSVVVEEFGLIGAIILFGIYALLVYRLLIVSKYSGSRFAKIVSGTLSIILIAYITINTSMVVGIFPVVGMPLPFISQGGTALVVNMATIGIILSLRRIA